MPTHPHMTATDARTFDAGERVSSMIRVAQALAERARVGCSCEAYRDVFTFRRWRAQGRTVRRGEHGIQLPVIVLTERTDEETGETVTGRMLHRSYVFCRCQTDTLPSRESRLAAELSTAEPGTPRYEAILDDIDGPTQ